MFAIVEKDVLVKDNADPRGDNLGVSFGDGWRGGEVGGKTYVSIASSTKPVFDALTQDCIEVTPALVAGVWTQQWAVTAASDADKAARLAAKRAQMVITPRQARLALLGAGLLGNVNDAITAAGDAAKITWEYATEIRRDNPLIGSLCAALGMSDAQIDALFIAAAQIA